MSHHVSHTVTRAVSHTCPDQTRPENYLLVVTSTPIIRKRSTRR